ncbi:MAG TPA: HPr family phosphocarrier protein [Candidatus Agathobaculum intestinigallinarum]|nr:HPr family phosphocarrier protein [Candidatus Agathobaculum intestinigallinarum]
MKTFNYEITDPIGIHARPAGQLAKTAKEFQSKITITHDDKQTEATRLMSLMGLGVRHGSTITVTAEGPDEEDAAARMLVLLQEIL